MRKPDMILFDYGDTLLCEPGFDALRGMHALFPYIINNPELCSPGKRDWRELICVLKEI